MKYDRPPGAGAHDFKAARDYELQVGEMIGPYVVDNLDSTTKLDFWVPGWFLDVKERKQLLSAKWPIPGGWDPNDAFILDELSVRKALHHYPAAYFWMHDCTNDRVFLARIDEVVCGDRVRLDRETSPGNSKGKWILNLSDYRELDREDQENVSLLILDDQLAMAWKQSPLLIGER